MDILSHGLWGAIAFGRKNRPSFSLAFLVGLAPDLLSFGVLWVAATLGISAEPDFSHGTPPESSIPVYVHHLYHLTHSGVVFLAVFLLVWVQMKRPVWELAAWGLHILVDIPTHSSAFFPTPVFWPLSDWHFDGWQWMTPAILVPNYLALAMLYAWYVSRRHRARARKPTVARSVS
jgi:hypothetical protein